MTKFWSYEITKRSDGKFNVWCCYPASELFSDDYPEYSGAFWPKWAVIDVLRQEMTVEAWREKYFGHKVSAEAA